MNNMAAAMPVMMMKSMKNSYRLVISNPSNFGYTSGAVVASAPAVGGISALRVPANLLAAALARNQVPIIRDESLSGASLETIDKPMGERHNSPMVCIMYK